MVSSPHLIPRIESCASGKDRSSTFHQGSSAGAQVSKVPGSYMKEIACGGRHSAVLTDAGGTSYFWLGSVWPGEVTNMDQMMLLCSVINRVFMNCGQGNNADQLRPTLDPSLLGTGVEKIAAGLWHTLCVTVDGQIYAFGGNQFGQLGASGDQPEREYDEARNQRDQLLDQNNHSPKGWQVYTRRKKGTRGNQKGGELVRIHMGSEFNGLGLGTYHFGSVRNTSVITGPTCRIPMETRLQARVEANEARLVQVEGRMEEMTKAFHDLKEKLIADQKDQVEFRKLFMKFVKEQGGRVNDDTEEESNREDSPERHRGYEDSAHMMAKRVELPPFDGGDPRGWLTRAETYFFIHGTNPAMKIPLARVCMEGQAVHWFSILLEIDPTISWEKFKVELTERFSGLEIQNPYEELAALKQKGGVQEFISEFEYLAALVPRQPEMQYVGYFLNGLNEEIQSWVRIHNPENQIQAMKLARNVEVALKKGNGRSGYSGLGRFNQVTRGPINQGPQTHKPHSSWSKPSPWGLSSDKHDRSNPVPPKPAGSPRRGTHNLTAKEWEERRRKGLCFRCAQPFNAGHRCPDPKLRVMLLGEDEELNEEGEIVFAEGDDDVEGEEGECSVLVSPNFGMSCNLEGVTAQPLKTMKLEGAVNGITILILVDSGATHNFISPTMVKALGIPVEEASHGLGIRLGDGHLAVTTGKCPNLRVSIGQYECPLNAWVLNMGGLDLILGVAWLRTLGEVTTNWETMTMRFKHQGKEVVLQGTCNSDFTALQSLIGGNPATVNKVNCGSRKTEGELVPTEDLTAEQVSELRSVLEKFPEVFQAPQGLPPPRNYDHRINLIPGQGPVNVRPYRYPHFHKDEIQKQVQELLQLGMIRTSNSAYSSPVILVEAILVVVD
ncbi:hypothetical protein RIF29_01900 [Crotalaria pallida]|uniref:Ty3 transposon capsid-like protein domain-containing protein n=1 Tax=Crotalaria pallida TaxID=3830 RepID=A0AAN9P891_CROPI